MEQEHAAAEPESEYPPDVRVVDVHGRRIVLVGTAHVSRESVDLVREVVDRERPDRVCVELDEARHRALTRPERWEALDLRQVVRERQLPTLLMNLLLASYQKKIGMKLGVMPGTELLEAVRVAERNGIPVTLADRSVRTTLLRAWRSMSLWRRSVLLSTVLAGIGSGEELTEDDLRRLRQRDVLTELLEELSRAMPTLKRALIDERDAYLAERIRTADGRRIVAVVGAGHLDGIERGLVAGTRPDLAELDEIPAVLPIGRWIGWLVPAVIAVSLGAIAWTHGAERALDNLTFWVLVNGIPAALGAIAALAHPLTVAAAFVAAPITSLTPVIGAGYVTAFVQAWVRPPRVGDFHRVTDDAATLGGWWRNRLLRVGLAFVLPTLGSLVGTYVGGARILGDLFR